MILLGEITRYSTGSLIGLFLASIVCVSGIAVLALKKTAIETKKNSQQETADLLLLAELNNDDNISGAGPDRINFLNKHSLKLLKMLTALTAEGTSKTEETAPDHVDGSEVRSLDFESPSLAMRASRGARQQALVGQSREALINDTIQSSTDDADDFDSKAY